MDPLSIPKQMMRIILFANIYHEIDTWSHIPNTQKQILNKYSHLLKICLIPDKDLCPILCIPSSSCQKNRAVWRFKNHLHV